MTRPHGGSAGMRDGAARQPAACPYCGSADVRTTGYDAPLRILRPRVWHYCTRCDWEAEAETDGRTAGIEARARG